MALSQSKIYLFDGAMGTVLQRKGLKLGKAPVLLNIEEPELITSIHKEYMAAGCDFVTTNTFSVNRHKVAGLPYTVEELVGAGVRVAKEAVRGTDVQVVLDIGPIGELLEPLGTLSFDEAYDLFAEQVKAGVAAGADCILVETMTDLYETKAAVLAAKEHSSLPVFATQSFDANCRTFTGCSLQSMAVTLEGLGVDALGINCSLGPKEILPMAKELLGYTSLPILIQPNAGLPQMDRETGKEHYDVTPDAFADTVLEMVKSGVQLVGGCCGTAPEYIAAVKKRIAGLSPVLRQVERVPVVCTPTKTVVIDHVAVVGERLNPTGKKRLKEALTSGDMDTVLSIGTAQVKAGAEILDVNVGLPSIDERATMLKVMRSLQGIIDTPLQIDSSHVPTLEAALRHYNGIPIVNSVNGTRESIEAVLPLVKKYGACVIGLALDESGISPQAEKRVEVAGKIIKAATEEYGIPKERVIIDCLTLTASTQQKEVFETLKALKAVKERYGVKTTLGVSNVSFGLPNRQLLSETFLNLALFHGLDLPIIDPNASGMMNTIRAFAVLSGRDESCERYVAHFSGMAAPSVSPVAAEGELSLQDIILSGYKEKAGPATAALLKTKEPLEIVDTQLIPALDIVGEGYEKGKLFLPQLISAAQTVQASFEVLKAHLAKNSAGSVSKGTIIVATVKGDIHDIGKNIVKVLLENYGYDIIDLGRDVDPQVVVDAILERGVRLVGLSALMTTTVRSMEETIKLIRKEAPGTTVMVGGAVLTAQYAADIGADYYARDAKEATNIAKKVLA